MRQLAAACALAGPNVLAVPLQASLILSDHICSGKTQAPPRCLFTLDTAGPGNKQQLDSCLFR